MRRINYQFTDRKIIEKYRRFRYLEGLKQLVDTQYDPEALTQAELKEYEELKRELEAIESSRNK